MQDNFAKWIWATDDFVHMLYRKLMSRRRYRDSVVPSFWKIDHFYESVVFQKSFKIDKSTKVNFFSCGEINVYLDNQNILDNTNSLDIIPGEHLLSISVYNENGLPCIFVDCENENIQSNETWLVNCGNNKLVPVETNSKFINKESDPNSYKLDTTYEDFKCSYMLNGGILYDFGKETFGYLLFDNLIGNGVINITYGESKEEALDIDECETLDKIVIEDRHFAQTQITKAFRYAFIRTDELVSYKTVGVLVEENGFVNKFIFESSDKLINKIYEVSLNTMNLTAREFFIDGIKRDRWVWSGDAYQSINMNFYSFYDREIVKNTIIALGGKNQFDMHANTIMDYSFYWIMSIYDYYKYTGDIQFVKKMFFRMLEVIEFCINRTNENGFMVCREGDWVFVDWADIDNRGEVCLEQILLCQSLLVMSKLGNLIEYDRARELLDYSNKLKNKIFEMFWKDNKFGFVHSIQNNQATEKITRYAGIFSILFDFLNEEQKIIIKENVLLNDQIQAITTPYMKFYELAALLELNETQRVLDYIRLYWGGMLELGATSFWEEYKKDLTGSAHYEMYGRKYGKSLCHAWGATPLLLLGKYFCGIKPSEMGYEEFEAKPNLGDLDWIKAEIPTNKGTVKIFLDNHKCTIYSTKQYGKLILKDAIYNIEPNIQYEFNY